MCVTSHYHLNLSGTVFYFFFSHRKQPQKVAQPRLFPATAAAGGQKAADMAAETDSTFGRWMYSHYFQFIREKDKNILTQVKMTVFSLAATSCGPQSNLATFW